MIATPEQERERWARDRFVAYIWWCGDSVCDCTQPVIERLRPNLAAGFPWIHRDTIWKGSFHSEADTSERDQQEAELRAESAHHGIALDAGLTGWRYAVEVAVMEPKP